MDVIKGIINGEKLHQSGNPEYAVKAVVKPGRRNSKENSFVVKKRKLPAK